MLQQHFKTDANEADSPMLQQHFQTLWNNDCPSATEISVDGSSQTATTTTMSTTGAISWDGRDIFNPSNFHPRTCQCSQSTLCTRTWCARRQSQVLCTVQPHHGLQASLRRAMIHHDLLSLSCLQSHGPMFHDQKHL